MSYKTKFLFISICGDAMPLCQRLEQIGYECYFYIHKHKAKAVGDGILKNKVDDYHEVLQNQKQKELVIVFDQNGLGYTADYLRRLGYKVVNGGSFADKLEYDRDYGTEVLSKIMDVPPTEKFTDWTKANDFLSKQTPDARFVFKPSGDVKSNKTYVSKDLEDMKNQIQYYESIWQKEEGDNVDFELQTFIPGTEVSFSGYFNGEKFIENAYTITFEEKKFMDGNIGPAVGCGGNIIWFMSGKEKYNQEVLNKLTPLLKQYGYIGQIDINNIFAEKDNKPYGLEFTSRWGYDSIYTEMALLGVEKFAQFLIGIAYKQEFDASFFPVGVRAMSVRLSVPPYPLGDCCITGCQRIAFPEKYMDNIFLEDVRMDEETYITGGIDGVTCNVVATGDSASEEIYKIIDLIKIPDVQYRTDIGVRTDVDLKEIEGWMK
jgi:phosphoribosylamine-glycine ligase